MWSSAPKRTELLTENPECFQCKSVVDREKDEAAVGIESALQEDSVPVSVRSHQDSEWVEGEDRS